MDLISVISNKFASASEIFATELVTWKEGNSVSLLCLSNVGRSILSKRFASKFPLIYALFCYDRWTQVMPGYSCFSLCAENDILFQGNDMIDNTKFKH
jgi:hypothetical protein